MVRCSGYILKPARGMRRTGLVEQAIEHALKAEDYAQMVQLLKDTALTQFGGAAHMHKIAPLFWPPCQKNGFVPSRTFASSMPGIYLLAGHQEAAEQVLQAAEQTVTRCTDKIETAIAVITATSVAGTYRCHTCLYGVVSWRYVRDYCAGTPGTYPTARR